MIRICIVVIIIFISCSATKSLLSDCKNNVTELLKGNWFYVKDSSYYKTNFRMLEQIKSEYKECIMKWNSHQIIQVFGTPSIIETKSASDQSPGKLTYDVRIPGDKTNTKWVFYFHRDNSVWYFGKENDVGTVK